MTLTNFEDPERRELSVNSKGDLVSDGRVIGEEVASVELEHSTFGIWAEDPDMVDPGDMQTTVASFGDVTSSVRLPGSSATYRGSSIGLARDGIYESSFATASDIEVRVTNGFRDVRLTSENTQLFDLNSNAEFVDTSYDFEGRGHVEDSGFEMDVENDFPNFDLSGTAKGNFYGPNGEEVGGVFNMSGTADSRYSGAFGAER